MMSRFYQKRRVARATVVSKSKGVSPFSKKTIAPTRSKMSPKQRELLRRKQRDNRHVQLWLATNPDTARHLSREQLEDTAGKLGLIFLQG